MVQAFSARLASEGIGDAASGLHTATYPYALTPCWMHQGDWVQKSPPEVQGTALLEAMYQMWRIFPVRDECAVATHNRIFRPFGRKRGACPVCSLGKSAEACYAARFEDVNTWSDGGVHVPPKQPQPGRPAGWHRPRYGTAGSYYVDALGLLELPHRWRSHFKANSSHWTLWRAVETYVRVSENSVVLGGAAIRDRGSRASAGRVGSRRIAWDRVGSRRIAWVRVDRVGSRGIAWDRVGSRGPALQLQLRLHGLVCLLLLFACLLPCAAAQGIWLYGLYAI